jgi:alcohol dehydrogenase (cytochrome c)
MRTVTRALGLFVALAVLAPLVARADVSYERLLRAGSEPQNWLTYSGSYASQRHSALREIRPSNATNLELKWVLQAQSLESFETTPLVVDGVMYLTEAPDTAVALDPATGRIFWRYQHNPAASARPCCGRVNRGLAILGERLFMATLDDKLIALDVTTGQPVWQKSIADPAVGYAMTLAPLVVKNKVIVGVAGGEYGIRGFISRRSTRPPARAWRFTTIPAPGEPGADSWKGGADSWRHGGASVWLTGSYDPSSISPTGASAIRGRIGTRRSGPATTCIPTASSRSMPTQAS